MTTFGRYTLVRRVGVGGMAEIWKAKAQGPAGFEKVLAIKKVLPHLVEDGEFIDMFVEEAKLVATLVHPNIVQVFDFGQVGKLDYFIAMEYVAGSNLAQVIRRLGERGSRFPLEVSLYVVLEACKGLGHAHGKEDLAGNNLGIVHRDVSPQNILVSFGGEVKVTDFGIAKVASALTRTAEGHVRGKLAYMSPEQANTRSVDNRSDLFSLCVVLYELCTGRRLFSGSSSSEIFAKVTGFKVPTDEDLSKIPYEVRSIIKQGLEPDPEARFQDATEMEQALTNALGPDGIVQARHALASVVQRLFDDERKLELTAADPVPVSPEYAETQAQGSGEVVSSVSARRQVVPRAEPVKAPSTPSGLTLAKDQPSAKAVTIAPGPMSSPSVVVGPAAGAPWKRIALYAVGAVALLLAGLAGNFLPALRASKPTPTPAPTAYASASPTATMDSVVLTESPLATPVTSATPLVAATAAAIATAVPNTSARPTPARTAVVIATTPRPTATPAPVAGFGYITVNARPWVQVFVDGKMVIAETPLRRHKLSAGRHTLRFQNPTTRFLVEKQIEIPADIERNIFVDVKTGAVTIK